ncbi:Cyclin N-terminal domain-containing protein [Mycena sanguinolenta]|uniref:Cyclin N-terminal domain-containing protein n=1 Tax=Mycena sanguinolenta TaxID=230812 RepID=A0A8H6YUU1_9AGAR|nr:Cyclin N-terminal domain-containing protein [Mycena sanguinolenta]
MNSPASSDYSSSSSSGSSSSYSSWSPSSKSSSSPVHPASLVDPSTHSPELMQLVDIEISAPVIDYVVDCVSEAVNAAFGRPMGFRTAHSRKFTHFVSNVLSRAEVTPATLLVTLVYIARSRHHLSIALEKWALERVFLGALIIASKYTQDSTLRNVHWGLVTGVFGKGDIGRIEREFLEVLDWDLGFSEADVLAHHDGLLAMYGVSELPTRPIVQRHTVVEAAPYSPSESVPIPELEPSSPHSSAGSLSPPTPVSHAVHLDMDVASPAHTLVSPHMDVDPAPAPVPATVPVSTQTIAAPAPTKQSVRPHGRLRLRDLLSPFHHHHHHHHQQHFAVEVAA